MRNALLLGKRFAPLVLLFCVMVFGMGQSGGGCVTTMNDMNAMNYGIMSRDPSYTPQQRAAFAGFSQFSATQAQREHERDIADRMKPQVNVNVGQQNTPSTPQNTVVPRGDRTQVGHNEWEAYQTAGDNALSNGQLDQAETLLQKALHVAELNFPPKNGRTAFTVYSLACVKIRQEQNYEAEALFKKALPVMEGAIPKSSATGDIYFKLAILAYKRNDLSEAQTLCEKAQTIFREGNYPDDLHRAESFADLIKKGR